MKSAWADTPTSVRKQWHPDRLAAVIAYETAIAKCNLAESISEEAWIAADAELDEARRKMTEQERLHPTHTETKRRNNRLYLANLGYDI